MEERILEKWKDLIYAAKAYWIDSIPTGMDDSTFDELEKRAIEEDGFYARDYVYNTYLKGTKTKNEYIEKIKKEKVEGKTMLEAILEKEASLGKLYCDLKYDGSSVALYIDPRTGEFKRAVTVGNQNLDNFGVDSTAKLWKHVPHRFPKGIVAIQCEALIDLNHLPPGIDPEKARQKANGLITSKYLQDEVDEYLTLRAYRYYTADSVDGKAISSLDYREVLGSFETIRSASGRIMFAPADVFTTEELAKNPGYCESDRTQTSTGLFLNDGWVLYNSGGVCVGALKYAFAGGESDGVIKTTVRSIKWNDQTAKGKDSWAANVIVDPVIVHGIKIVKPSAGSVGKLVRNKISPGAEVSVILANSTIPQVSECFKPGNEDYQFPVCACGYHMSASDIYGARLKCGNPRCSVREGRMEKYLRSVSDWSKLDLNKLLVIDGFDFGKTDIDVRKLLKLCADAADEENETRCPATYDYYGDFRNYLMSYMNTDARKRNLDLVVGSAWFSIRNVYGERNGWW